MCQNYCKLIVPDLLNFLFVAMALSDQKRRVYKEEESVQKKRRVYKRRGGCTKKRRVQKKRRVRKKKRRVRKEEESVQR